MARGVLGYILDRGAQVPFLNLSKAYFLEVNHLSSHSLNSMEFCITFSGLKFVESK